MFEHLVKILLKYLAELLMINRDEMDFFSPNSVPVFFCPLVALASNYLYKSHVGQSRYNYDTDENLSGKRIKRSINTCPNVF